MEHWSRGTRLEWWRTKSVASSAGRGRRVRAPRLRGLRDSAAREFWVEVRERRAFRFYVEEDHFKMGKAFRHSIGD